MGGKGENRWLKKLNVLKPWIAANKYNKINIKVPDTDSYNSALTEEIYFLKSLLLLYFLSCNVS